MRVLVSVASRHGATLDIGEAVAESLEMDGIDVVHVGPDDWPPLESFDAFVVGSAVYGGRWLKAGRELVERLAGSDRPVWLFSSGPVGDPPKPDQEPVDIAELAGQVNTRDHRVFAGALDRSKLGIGERLIVGAVKAPDGDFRDFSAIKDWAQGIALELGEAKV